MKSGTRAFSSAGEGDDLFAEKMEKLVRIPPPLPIRHKPEVILLVGVNGSGKTTTAAKLAARAQKEGRAVHLGAADTFPRGGGGAARGVGRAAGDFGDERSAGDRSGQCGGAITFSGAGSEVGPACD